MQDPPRAFQGRSTFVDALRGIAALSVACYHIFRYGPLPELADPVVPGILKLWFDHGWMGVQVFFVISGFVIAYSVRNARITPGYVGNYAFRRSIRLGRVDYIHALGGLATLVILFYVVRLMLALLYLDQAAREKLRSVPRSRPKEA